MAYTKTNWKDFPATDTPVNADNLNKIEEGIYTNDQALAKINRNITIADGTSISLKSTGVSGNLSVSGNSTVNGNSTVSGTTTNNGSSYYKNNTGVMLRDADNTARGGIVINASNNYDIATGGLPSSGTKRNINIGGGTTAVNAINLLGTTVKASNNIEATGNMKAASANVTGSATVGTLTATSVTVGGVTIGSNNVTASGTVSANTISAKTSSLGNASCLNLSGGTVLASIVTARTSLTTEEITATSIKAPTGKSLEGTFNNIDSTTGSIGTLTCPTELTAAKFTCSGLVKLNSVSASSAAVDRLSAAVAISSPGIGVTSEFNLFGKVWKAPPVMGTIQSGGIAAGSTQAFTVTLPDKYKTVTGDILVNVYSNTAYLNNVLEVFNASVSGNIATINIANLSNGTIKLGTNRRIVYFVYPNV